MTDPLISIVIPVYNSEKFIGRCLDSLHNQTYRNWEAIVVIAPSTDNTFKEIAKRASSKITVIHEQKKTNCATARNMGYASSKGIYLYFLDSDDWLEPTCLEELVEALDNNTRLSWMASYQRTHWDNNTYIIDKCPGVDYNIGGIGSILFRRECLEHIIKTSGGLFNEQLKHTDDGDLMLRARKYPHDIIPVVLSNYQWNHEGLTANTHWWEQQSGIVRMMFDRGAWDLLPRGIFNLCLVGINETFHIDIVKMKKELLK